MEKPWRGSVSLPEAMVQPHKDSEWHEHASTNGNVGGVPEPQRHAFFQVLRNCLHHRRREAVTSPKIAWRCISPLGA